MAEVLTHPLTAIGDWTAMSVFGREQDPGNNTTTVTSNGIPLSVRSVALMCSDPAWLIELKDVFQRFEYLPNMFPVPRVDPSKRYG